MDRLNINFMLLSFGHEGNFDIQLDNSKIQIHGNDNS